MVIKKKLNPCIKIEQIDSQTPKPWTTLNNQLGDKGSLGISENKQ
jgi:hypothetical protein